MKKVTIEVIVGMIVIISFGFGLIYFGKNIGKGVKEDRIRKEARERQLYVKDSLEIEVNKEILRVK